MLHWIIPSSSKLNHLIECFWFIEKASESGESFPKLNPDPCAHLILAPGSEPYTYECDTHSESGLGSHFLLAHQKTFELDHSKPFTHLGVKFKVGMPYTLPIIESNEVPLDRAIQLNISGLLNFSDSKLNDLLALARHRPEQCVAQLETLLSPWLEQSKGDQHSQLTSRVTEELQRTPISELADKLHCSQRTIERSFRRVTGLTLKQYQSMTKLELMLEFLHQKQPEQIDWVDIAFEFGFSDQPHLIRYLKQHIGTTPTQYVSERGFTIDIYGSVSSSYALMSELNMIRKIQDSELDTIVSLWYHASVQAHSFIDKAFWRNQMTPMKEVFLPNSETYVLEEKGNILGFISYYQGVIPALFVSPTVQSQGIGSQLLNFLKLQHQQLKLAVYAQNHGARRFYLAQGFKENCRKPCEHTGHEEVLMEWCHI